MRFEPAAVRAGAIADLAVMVPVVALYSALRATGIASGDAPVIATAVLAGLLAPLVGGTVAGRRGGPVPLTNGAMSGGVAALAFLVFRIVDGIARGTSVNAASAVTLALIAMTLGLLGGYAGFRSTRQTHRS